MNQDEKIKIIEEARRKEHEKYKNDLNELIKREEIKKRTEKRQDEERKRDFQKYIGMI